MSPAQNCNKVETLQAHGGVRSEGQAGPVVGGGGVPQPVDGGGGVPLPVEALNRVRDDGLDRLRARVGDPDDRGVALLLELVGGLGEGGGVDDDPAGVVVGRVDCEGFPRRHIVALIKLSYCILVRIL